MLNPRWPAVAKRIVQGLGVQPGELIQVRCTIDRLDVLQEILLAIELSGATPLPEITTYLDRLISEASLDYLAGWDQRRARLMQQYDRVLVLQGTSPNFDLLPLQNLDAWRGAIERLVSIEEERHLPVLIATIPTEGRAQRLGLSLEQLEEIMLPALNCSVDRLQAEINRVLEALQDSSSLLLRTGPNSNFTLKLRREGRIWLKDDGFIDEQDRIEGAIASNLPAGSVYTTVIEDTAEGSLYLPKVHQASQVVFHFEQGRITEIEAAEGTEDLERWFDSHTGEPRRISHIGIGLNPALLQTRLLDWIIVDEHIYGNLFLALGENRYMGGQNASSLNVDFVIEGATLSTEERVVVREGKVLSTPDLPA
ncbi:MAG TPA: aminopeptidase [Chloroflexia bacterium]|nr:aminopeptidase [Chloroflexia bacterium]